MKRIVGLLLLTFFISPSLVFSQNSDSQKADEVAAWIKTLIAENQKLKAENAQVAQLKSDLSSAQKSASESTAKVTALSSEVALLTQKVSKIEADSKTLIAERDKYKSLLDQVQTSLATANDLLSSSKNLLIKVRDQYLLPLQSFAKALGLSDSIVTEVNTAIQTPVQNPKK